MSTVEGRTLRDNDIPNVLLFGHRGSGKSALLGALLRASETQGATLQGQLIEPNGRLAALRDELYRGGPIPKSQDELTSYLISVKPEVSEPTTQKESLQILVTDCSGQAAENLLEHLDEIPDQAQRLPLAQAVIGADAILLLLDATSSHDELQAAFEEFDAFLTVVAQTLAKAREVGGMPILLVLTKCDQLANPGDTRAKWLERVNQRADQAWMQFDAFLKDADPDDDIPSPFLPFGSIDLSVYTVAIRWPKLIDCPSKDDSPFQVAELFRDAFHAACIHRKRVTTSNHQLKITVRMVVSLLMALIIAIGFFALYAPLDQDPELAQKVDAYRRYEPEVAVRLAEPRLSENKRRLKSYQDDPRFLTLPADLRDFVISRWAEIINFENYRNRLLQATAPGDVRSLDDLDRIEHSLQVEFALPSPAWADTWVGQLRAKWLKDIVAIRESETRFLERYRNLDRRARELTLTPGFGGNWRSDVNLLFADGAEPTAAELLSPLPGSPSLNIPRGQAVLTRVAFEFDRVYHARKQWEATRDHLSHLKDLADALGLTTGPGRPEAALAIPEPSPGVDSGSLASLRWASLLKNFNHELNDFEQWQVTRFRDPGRSLLDAQLEKSFRNGVRHVQMLLERKLEPLGPHNATPEHWRQLAAEIGNPASQFLAWGRLLHLIARLRNPDATNPVVELINFLRQGKFELNLLGFELRNPSLEGLVPLGSLLVTHFRGEMEIAKKQFKISGNDSANHFYFSPEEDSKIIYLPGDNIRAELAVRLGNQAFKLVWDTGPTKSFQFDRLEGEPRLIRPDGRSEPATNVKLSPKAGSTVPRLPILFPGLQR
jgi:GTPase SAR1 family protein